MTTYAQINVDELLTTLTEWLTLYGIKLLAALAIFVIGRWVAKVITGWVRKSLGKSKIEPSLIGFICNLTSALLLAFVVIAALSQIGVQTTSLVAVVGAAGLAIGLALQGSLSNFAAGVLILIFKPYRVDDYIAAGGGEGVVKEIGIFTTTLLTLDNKTQIIPNSTATSGMIENFSEEGIRRLDLVAGISYGDDLLKAKSVLQGILDAESRVLKDPTPTIGLMEMGDSSINIAFRPWVKVDDYWDLFFDLQEQIKLRFDEEGLTIPFPQRDVHLIQGDQ